jgi:dienelactone hydrolase
MLAELGYVAFAPDLYGERFESREQGMRFIQQLAADAQKLRARARAALQALKALTQVDAARTAAIGYCFGGMVVLEMARDSCDLRCVVSFHGSLQSAQPMAPSNGACKILVCTGADDPFATPAQRATFEEEMKGAGANWQMSIYGNTRHGFTNRQADSMKAPGVAYSELADTRSWRAMRDLFEETLAPP